MKKNVKNLKIANIYRVAAKCDHTTKTLNTILGEVDDGNLTIDERKELVDYININNHGRITMTAEIEYDIEVDAYIAISQYCYYSGDINNEIGYALRQHYTDKKDLYQALSKLGIKGIRDNQDLYTLIKKAVKGDTIMDESKKQKIYDSLSYQHRHEYIVFSNDSLAQLTSTYTDNYSSCYDLSCGGYRASNVYLMADKNNYVIKCYKYSDNITHEMLCTSIQYEYGNTARRNIHTDHFKTYYLMNKCYGDDSGIIAQNDEIINLVRLVSEWDDVKLNKYSKPDYEYTSHFNGYEDYNYNLSAYATSDDYNGDIYVEIGDDKHVTWDIVCDGMIIHEPGLYSQYNECYIEEDEAVYVGDDDDYYYGYQVYYDNNRDEYYAYHNTDYVELNGDYYNLDYLDVTYNA